MTIAAAAPVQKSFDGTWFGGFEVDGKWHPAYARFKTEKESIKIEMSTLFRRINAEASVQVQDTIIRFKLTSQSGAFSFIGQVKDEVISGEVKYNGKSGPFALHRTRDPSTFNPLMGFYQAGDNSFLYIQRWGELGNNLMSIDESARIRALFPTAELSFLSGPSLLKPLPVESSIEFIKNAAGEVMGLRRFRKNQPVERLQKIAIYDREDVTFPNGEIILSGSLLLPRTKGPYPVMVITHGSNAQDRYSGLLFNATLLRQGVALFVYDKRGVGQSGGNWLEASFADLAEDAIAAVNFLKKHKKINPGKIGILGLSQGGWIAPLAASRCSDIAFVVAISAAAVSPVQQELTRTEYEMRTDGYPDEEIQESLKLYKLMNHYTRTGQGWDEYIAARQKAKSKKWGPTGEWTKDQPYFRFWKLIMDYDPVPVLHKITLPILVIYGGLDQNVRADINQPIMEKALQESGSKDHKVLVYPKGNHIMMEASTGSNLEFPFLKRFVPGYYETVADWILKHVSG